MARTDNLTNFLTDVADSIREKKGTSEPILASNFDTEIDGITTGNVGTEIEDALIMGTLEEYTNDRVTTINIPIASNTLKKISLPNVENITKSNILSGARALEEVYFPKLKSITGSYFLTDSKVENFDFPMLEILNSTGAFYSNNGLVKFVFPKLHTLNSAPFSYSTNFKEAIFLKNDDICKLGSGDAFSNTGITSDTGKILVPNHLLEKYKSATNWSRYADIIYGLDIASIEISVKDEMNIYHGKTLQLKVTYNGGSDSLFYEEQMGYNLTVEGNATVDENDLLTLTDNAVSGDVIRITAVSTYDNTITDTKEITLVYKDKYVEIDLNNGEWIDSGTTVDGNIVYKSDKNSYQVNNGKSVARINVLGYKQVKLYIRSYSETGYDYVEAFNADVTAVRGTGAYPGKNSETEYSECVYNLDGGQHFIEIMYSKDSSGNKNDDRGYFYIGECSL